MRDIKFRGKRVDNGEWVEGYYLSYNFGGTIEKPNMLSFIAEDFIDHCQLSDRLVEVDPLTVGQFTGLKDKNGKEIYEGDIIRRPLWGSREIFWDNKQLAFCIHNIPEQVCEFWRIFSETDTEVIGNIHDNPDLLKE